MKVSDPKALEVVPAAKAGSDGPVRSVAPVEKVSTQQSAALATAVNQARAAMPADRSARIREIAQAVKQGHYQPNPQQIAEQIVDDAELEARLRALLTK
jgi:flagellar biosynthesis anti-sigma factor FlgM